MARELFDKKGNSKIVEDRDVQTMLKSGWKLFKPVVAKTEKTSTTRRKATLRIEKAEAEVLKPIKEENDG